MGTVDFCLPVTCTKNFTEANQYPAELIVPRTTLAKSRGTEFLFASARPIGVYNKLSTPSHMRLGIAGWRG